MGAYDSENPKAPRNAQVVRLTLLDAQGHRLALGKRPRPIRQLQAKALYYELGMNATDCSPLLDDVPPSRAKKTWRPRTC